MAKQVFWGVAACALFLVFKVAAESIADAPHWLHEVETLLQIAAYCGMASIFLHMICHHMIELVAPKFGEAIRDDILPKVMAELKELGKELIRTLREKDFVVRTSKLDIEQLMNERVASELMAADGDANLEEAKKAIAAKDPEKAIRLLRTAHGPEHKKHLLSALVISPKPEHRKEALALLGAYGEPTHYVTLAYYSWKDGDTKEAIRLAQAGLKLAQPGTSVSGALRNSLAYYYADAGLDSKRDEAFEFAREEEALRRSTQSRSPRLYGSTLDTLGFVQIRFGATKEEVYEGMQHCMRAHQLGTPDDLLFKHLAVAKQRLSSLPNAAGSSVPPKPALNPGTAK